MKKYKNNQTFIKANKILCGQRDTVDVDFFSFPLREVQDVKMLLSLNSLCCLCLCVEFCLQGCLTTYIFFKMIGFKIVHMDVCVPGWRYMRHLYVHSKDERLLYPWNKNCRQL